MLVVKEGIMRKGILSLALMLVIILLIVGCKKEPDIKNYKVGASGPAGGIIFYDCDADNDIEYTADDGTTKKNKDGLSSALCGWRFLEAATSDLPGTYEWGSNGSCGTKKELGEGASNTSKLIGSTRETTKSFPAAKACDDYALNGYEDWFLPSYEEINLMYTELYKKGLGSFTEGSGYWSSYEDITTSSAWFQEFSSSGVRWFTARNNSFRVRPIRAFK